MVYTVCMIPPSTQLTLADLQQAEPGDTLSTSNGVIYRFTTAGKEHFLSQGAIALLDVRLPVVIAYLTMHHSNTAGARQALAATLRYWANPDPIVMETVLNNIHTGVANQTPMYSIVVLDHVQEVSDDLVEDAMFEFLYLASDLVTHQGVTFVKHVSSHLADCPYTWCEQHFPGSVARLKSAMALDLSKEDVAQFGFYTETVPADILQTITLPASMTELLP